MINFNTVLEGRNVLLTGGTGFIGKNILNFLYKNKILLNRLTLVTRDIKKFKEAFPLLYSIKNIDFIETDIINLKYNNLKYDYVIHAATSVVDKVDRLQLSEDIVGGTIKALEFAIHSGAKSFINFSSGAVYGKFDKLNNIVEGADTLFKLDSESSTYGLSKIFAEHISYLFAMKNKLKVTTLRCFAFAGNYLDPVHYAISDFIIKALKNQQVIVNASKNIFRSYLLVDELVEWMFFLLARSLQREQLYEFYNIGSDCAISLPDLAYRVKQVLNSDIEISCPNLEEKYKMYYVPNIDKIKLLGLNIKYDLDQVILITADYFKSVIK